MNAAINAELRS